MGVHVAFKRPAAARRGEVQARAGLRPAPERLPVGHPRLVVGYGINAMNAIQVGNRLILNNGSHRGYALRSLDIAKAPCIIQRMTRRDELESYARGYARVLLRTTPVPRAEPAITWATPTSLRHPVPGLRTKGGAGELAGFFRRPGSTLRCRVGPRSSR